MPTISPQLVSVIKSLGVVIIFAVLTWLSDAGHISVLVGGPIAGLVAAVASWLETDLKQGTNTALFGSVKVSSQPF